MIVTALLVSSDSRMTLYYILGPPRSLFCKLKGMENGPNKK